MSVARIVIADNNGVNHSYQITGYNRIEDVTDAIAKGAGLVKFVTGCANNAAYALMTDARDQLRQHVAWRANTRNARYLYQQAFKEWDAYEKRLFNSKIRFFSMKDMSENTRKKYGDISDREYFEFWRGQGFPIYVHSRPMVTSLWNKYRVALIHHERPCPDETAWGMTAMSGIEQACCVLDAAKKDICETYGFPPLMVDRIFDDFSIKRVKVSWYRALTATDPFAGLDNPFDEVEQRNIELGIEQLCISLCDADNMYDSTIQTISDYEEIFRTPGEMKKSIRELFEMKKLSNV